LLEAKTPPTYETKGKTVKRKKPEKKIDAAASCSQLERIGKEKKPKAKAIGVFHNRIIRMSKGGGGESRREKRGAPRKTRRMNWTTVLKKGRGDQGNQRVKNATELQKDSSKRPTRG